MSKKLYKRNQNRLYREIKRRIIAEQASKLPIPVVEIHRNVETIGIRKILPNYLVHEIEFVKADMVNAIAKKLVAEGFVEILCRENAQIADVVEIEARICVAKPTKDGR